MSGFSNATDGDFDRVFTTTSEIVDRFVGSRLWGCGYNGGGALGDNTTIKKSSPVQVYGGSTNWKQVAGGGYHTAAIKTDGTLWCWGGGNFGVLGNNTVADKSSPVQTIAGGTNWMWVSCGYRVVSSIKTDGTLWCWGYNAQGQLGDNNIADKSSPVQTITGGNNWKQSANGKNFTSAIKTDGTLWLWGGNGYGQLGDNTNVDKSSPVQTIAGGTNWKLVSACNYTTCAIKNDGTLWGWGTNGSGQLGTGVSANNIRSPVQTVAGGTTWKQVAVGFFHTCAIKTDGTLWVWGQNDLGQLGSNNTSSYSSPIQTSAGGTNWKQVACGYKHTVAIKIDGSLWSWGQDIYGQLGDNSITNKSAPVNIVSNTNNWKYVAAGKWHVAAIGE